MITGVRLPGLLSRDIPVTSPAHSQASIPIQCNPGALYLVIMMLGSLILLRLFPRIRNAAFGYFLAGSLCDYGDIFRQRPEQRWPLVLRKRSEAVIQTVGTAGKWFVTEFLWRIFSAMVIAIPIERGIRHHKGVVSLSPEGQVIAPGDTRYPGDRGQMLDRKR